MRKRRAKTTDNASVLRSIRRERAKAAGTLLANRSVRMPNAKRQAQRDACRSKLNDGKLLDD